MWQTDGWTDGIAIAYARLQHNAVARKNEWPTNSPDLNPLDYHVWLWCWDAIRNTRQNRPTLPSWRLLCYRYGMICHWSSLISQSCHFERDFDHVLLQLVDILNTQFKCRERAADIHHWNVWAVDEKVVQSLIRYYWIFRTRLHVHLEKWTLKFKLLYLLNHIYYFNKICSVYGLNPHL